MFNGKYSLFLWSCSIVSMVIFNSYVSLPEGICVYPLVNLADSPETNDEPRARKSQGSQPAAASPTHQSKPRT